MKTLIVTAHPSKSGYTHIIANSYKKGVESSGGQAEILNLYDNKNHQDYLSFETPREFCEDDNREIFQKKIKESDELIFVFPIWWGGMPGIMKNFFDMNFGVNFAFKYENGKGIGLLKGKTSKVFCTCDAPKIMSLFYSFTLKPLIKYGILDFCGIKVSKFKIFSNMHHKSEQDRKKILDNIY